MSDWTLCDCPHCGNTLRIDATSADEWTQCPACRRHAHIPDLLTAHAETTADRNETSDFQPAGFAWGGSSFGNRRPTNASDSGEPPADEAETTTWAGESTWQDEEDTIARWDSSPDPDEDSAPAREVTPDLERGPDTENDEPAPEFDYSELGEEDPDAPRPAKAKKARRRRFGLFGETPEWDHDDPRIRENDVAGRRVIASGVAIVVAGAIVLSMVMFSSSGRIGGEARDTTSSLPPIILPTEVGVPLPAEEARQKLQFALQTRPQETVATIKPAIEAFLNAPTWQERARYVRDAERIRPLMEEYYRTHADGPIPFLRVADESENIGYRGNLLFLRLILRDYSTKQIEIEYTGAEFLVDWESFVGYGEMPVERFREERPVKPVLMRVTFAPAVPPYFNYAFTDEENMECYLLTFPDESYVFGYTMKFSPTSNRLREMRGESVSALAVVKLRYPENAPVGDQVWIDEVVADTWILHEATRTEKP